MNTKIKNCAAALLFLFLGSNCLAQTPYYRINGDKAVSEKEYKEMKSDLARRGRLEEVRLRTMIGKDSTIHYVQLGTLVTTPDGKDPWGEAKKRLGTQFKIEDYVGAGTNNFKPDHLAGKPTFINFWFTRCPPCIEELPLLDQLKAKYGDKVNFISITFDDRQKVDAFLKKHKFDYSHITDAGKQIDALHVSAFPTNLILDKNGVITTLYGAVNEFRIKQIETIIDILLL